MMAGDDLSGVDPPSPLESTTETLNLVGDDSGPLSAVPAALHGGDPLLNPPPPPLDSPTSSPHPVSDRALPFFDPLEGGDGEGDDGVGVSGGGYPISPSHRRDPSPPSRRLMASEYSGIAVSDPQKEQESSSSLIAGGGNYVTYLITTRISGGDGMGKAEYRVRRRFRDVVALADRLADVYRGFFIPARPDKGLVEGQLMYKHEFVEQRRLALEKYLHRLSAHPVIGRSDDLRSFLTGRGNWHAPGIDNGVMDVTRQPVGNGGAYASVGTQDEGAHPAKGGRDFMRIFRELKQSMVPDWVGAKQITVEEDKDFLERKEKIRDLEQQLTTTSQQAELLVKSQQEVGETMGELGLAFIKLAKFETEQATHYSRERAADIKRFATAAVKASRFYRELNAQTVKNLATLHEYLGLMLAVHSAFSDRSSALLTVQTLVSDLSTLYLRAEKLQSASSKAFGIDKSRIRKVEDLKETIRVTEDSKQHAVGEYERIKENNRYELERLERETHEDFLAMLKGFVVNQVDYAQKLANVWADEAQETKVYVRENI